MISVLMNNTDATQLVSVRPEGDAVDVGGDDVLVENVGVAS